MPSAKAPPIQDTIDRRGLGWIIILGGALLELFKRTPDQTMKSLIEWGAQGHYPLFDRDWLGLVTTSSGTRLKALTINEKGKVKSILKRIAGQKSFERKRTVLFSLNEDDRQTFIRAFMNAVENKILDNAPELH